MFRRIHVVVGCCAVVITLTACELKPQVFLAPEIHYIHEVSFLGDDRFRDELTITLAANPASPTQERIGGGVEIEWDLGSMVVENQIGNQRFVDPDFDVLEGPLTWTQIRLDPDQDYPRGTEEGETLRIFFRDIFYDIVAPSTVRVRGDAHEMEYALTRSSVGYGEFPAAKTIDW